MNYGITMPALAMDNILRVLLLVAILHTWDLPILPKH